MYESKVYAVCKRRAIRGTQNVQLYGTSEFLKYILSVCTYMRVYPKGNTNRRKDSIKNNVQDVNVDARTNLFMIFHKTLIVPSPSLLKRNN